LSGGLEKDSSVLEAGDFQYRTGFPVSEPRVCGAFGRSMDSAEHGWRETDL